MAVCAAGHLPWISAQPNSQAGEGALYFFPDGVSGVSVCLAILATHRKDAEAHEC